MGIKELEKVLNYYKNLKPQRIRYKTNNEVLVLKGFSNREFIEEDTRNEEVRIDPSESAEKDIELQKNLILTYLKVFYGKTSSNFNSKSYQEESTTFNEKIKNNPIVARKIEEILKTGKIDVKDYKEGGILENIIPKDLRNQTLDSISDVQGVLTKSHMTISRVYVNPNSENFDDFLNFVLKECLLNEIDIRSKVRLNHGEGELDNIIFYIESDNLGRFLKILNTYEKNNKEKVSQFNSTPGLLQKNSHKWYGYGMDPQRVKTTKGFDQNITLNDVIDFNYTNILLPVIILKHFEKIIKGREKEIYNYLIDENGLHLTPEEAKKLIEDPNYRNSIMDEIMDFQDAQEYSEKNSLVGINAVDLGKEPFLRFKENTLPNIAKRVAKLVGGKFQGYTEIERTDLTTGETKFKFDYNTHFHKLFADYLSDPVNYEKVLSDMEYYERIYLKEMPYISSNNPYLSQMQEDEIERMKRIVLEFSQLIRRKSSCKTLNDFVTYKRTLSEYFKSVGGLDGIINAIDYCEGIEAFDNRLVVERAKQFVAAAREDRGEELFIDLITQEKKETDLKRLEVEDVEEVDKNKESNVETLIRKLEKRMLNLEEQERINLYVRFINTFENIPEMDKDRIISSINQQVVKDNYSRRRLEMLVTKKSGQNRKEELDSMFATPTTPIETTTSYGK